MAAPLQAPPIPPEVLEVLHAQAAALAKVNESQKAKLLALSREVVADLEAALRRLAPGKFTTQETRVKLVQVRAIVDILGAELGERIGNEVQGLGALAARIGRDGLIEQIAAWAGKFPGSVRRISPAELAGDVLDRGLLEYYETSRQTYGMEAIAKMRGALSLGVIKGQTIQQTTEALAAAAEISEGRAERIVRTESSFAAHRRQVLDAKDADLGLAKMLISTFDNRTGQDSVFVHEQVRELDEPFSDNEGRVYQHPPNRPNDRETVVFVPNTLNELGPPAEDDAGEAEERPAAPAGPRLAAGGYSAATSAGPPPSAEDLAIFDRMTKKLGVRVDIGAHVDARFDRKGPDPVEARFIPIDGQPGEVLVRARAPRSAYYEEAFHATQHAARKLREPTDRELIEDEIMAQEFLIFFGNLKGWTDEELLQQHDALRYWNGRLARDKAKRG